MIKEKMEEIGSQNNLNHDFFHLLRKQRTGSVPYSLNNYHFVSFHGTVSVSCRSAVENDSRKQRNHGSRRNKQSLLHYNPVSVKVLLPHGSGIEGDTVWEKSVPPA